MNCECYGGMADKGPNPYVADIGTIAGQNRNFRTAVWTGSHLQMTLMCIPPRGEIGLEMHSDTDQYVRVEHGNAIVKMGRCKDRPDFCQNMCVGDGVFIPAGMWHNIVNAETDVLKVSSVYGPPNHARGTVHRTKADAEMEE